MTCWSERPPSSFVSQRTSDSIWPHLKLDLFDHRIEIGSLPIFAATQRMNHLYPNKEIKRECNIQIGNAPNVQTTRTKRIGFERQAADLPRFLTFKTRNLRQFPALAASTPNCIEQRLQRSETSLISLPTNRFACCTAGSEPEPASRIEYVNLDYAATFSSLLPRRSLGRLRSIGGRLAC